METINLEPTPQEIEQRKKEVAALFEGRRKAAFLAVNERCPSCDFFPLEEQQFGYEKSIFCPNCPYQKMISED